MKDATHFMATDKPEELYQLMVNFFEEKVSGKFEIKPRYELACE